MTVGSGMALSYMHESLDPNPSPHRALVGSPVQNETIVVVNRTTKSPAQVLQAPLTSPALQAEPIVNTAPVATLRPQLRAETVIPAPVRTQRMAAADPATFAPPVAIVDVQRQSTKKRVTTRTKGSPTRTFPPSAVIGVYR